MSLLAFHRLFIVAAIVMVSALAGWSHRQSEVLIFLVSLSALLVLLVYGWRALLRREVV